MALSLVTKTSATLTAGTTNAGTDANIDAKDGVSWDIAGAIQTIDITFDLTNLFVAELNYTARHTGHKDGHLIIQAWDPTGLAWVTISNASTQINSGLEFIDQRIGLDQSYVAGDNTLKIRVTGSGLIQTPITYLDYFALLANTTNDYVLTASEVADAVVQRMTTAVYAGRIHLDTVNGHDDSDYGVSGTAQYPVKTIAHATLLADAIGTSVIALLSGSAVVLDQAYNSYSFIGISSSIDLNGQSISKSTFNSITVIGNDDGSNTDRVVFNDCAMQSNLLGICTLNGCSLAGTITLAQAGDYFFDQCYSAVAGTGAPGLDFGATIGDSNVSLRHYSGGIQIFNMGVAGSDAMSLEGNGQIKVDASCVGGVVAIRGHFPITDNSGEAVTFSDDARFTVTETVNAIWDENNAGHVLEGSVGLNQSQALSDDDSRLDNLDAAISSRATQVSVDAISQAVLVDGVKLDPVAQAEIAATLLKLGVAGVENEAEAFSLAEAVLLILNSNVTEDTVSFGTVVVYKTTGGVFSTRKLLLSNTARSITGVGPNVQ